MITHSPHPKVLLAVLMISLWLTVLVASVVLLAVSPS